MLKKYEDKEWLERKYIDERLSTVEIGKICGRDKSSIGNWLKRFDIPCRSSSEINKGKHYSSNTEFKKGQVGYWEGKTRSKETIEKMREGNRGKHLSPNTEFKKGDIGYWTNKQRSKKTIDKIIKTTTGKIRPEIVGENNPNWKGGVTPIRSLIRSTFKYKNWRNQCFIRDKYTCQNCFQVGGRLVVYHNKNSYEILIQNAKNCIPLLPLFSACMLYDPLWDINNGITLCKKCHKEIHEKRGYKLCLES